jgi:RNA polymerase sigma-70 factor, ECF subfamily
MASNDASLLRLAQRGDPNACVEIYNRHYPVIYTYIFYRVGEACLAEDLASEVFVRMVDKISTFDLRDRPLLAWLYTIAHHLVIDHYRRSRPETILPLDERIHADPQEHPVRQTELRLDQQSLYRAIGCLTEDQRRVILLKFIDDHSNAEIARLLGKDEGAVKSLQHRALDALRREFAKETQHGD